VKGNAAVAILLTVASNMLGVFTMPLLLPLLLGGALPPGALRPLALLWQLVLCVLLPTLAGAAARGYLAGAGRARAVGRHLEGFGVSHAQGGRLQSHPSAAALPFGPACKRTRWPHAPAAARGRPPPVRPPPGVGPWVDANKRGLAKLSALLLALVPWTQVNGGRRGRSSP
jgi:hypothetical protein